MLSQRLCSVQMILSAKPQTDAMNAVCLQVIMYMDCLHGKWLLDMIKAVFSRRYLLQNCAVEVYTSTGSKLCHFVCTHSSSFFLKFRAEKDFIEKIAVALCFIRWSSDREV